MFTNQKVMNSSDIIARRKAQAIYIDLIAKFKAATPSNDCDNICNCAATNCQKRFQSYQIKQDFKKGSTSCPCAPESE